MGFTWEYRTYMVGNTGCLISGSELNNGGYGPHRRRWINEFGPVPDGMDLDHLCRNRWCVNTAHLELVTRKENLARGKRSSRRDESKCRNGLHDWTEQNIFVGTNGKPICRKCRDNYQILYRLRAKEL